MIFRAPSRKFLNFLLLFCLLSGAFAPIGVRAGADKKLVELDADKRKLSEIERIQAEEDAILQAQREEKERAERLAQYKAEAKAAAEAARQEKLAQAKRQRIQRAAKIRDLELAKRNLAFARQLRQLDTTTVSTCDFWCKLGRVLAAPFRALKQNT